MSLLQKSQDIEKGVAERDSGDTGIRNKEIKKAQKLREGLTSVLKWTDIVNLRGRN